MTKLPTNVDVVVAGSGAAGLAAAVTLAEGGASVAVFEKQRSLGGTSNFFHGTFAVGSEMQRERYIDYGSDDAFRNIMEYSHWKANARLVRAIVDESAATISWLKERGVQFSGQMVNMPGSPNTYHVIRGSGEAVVKALVTRAKEAGASVFPGVAVVGLSVAAGRVVGVTVEEEGGEDGDEVEVGARAVFIGTGGYLNNKEWVKRYTGHELGYDLVAVGNTGKMGDGIRMAWEVGASEDGIGGLELVRVAPVGPDFAMGNDLEVVAMQPDLYVTVRGERFCDESVAFYDTHSGNANARFRSDGYTFSLFDDSIIERVLADGVERALTVEHPPGYRPVDVYREIDAAVARGDSEVSVTESVEELALAMGVEPEALRETVDQYNESCRAGRDRLFAKPAQFLRPLVGPKYYAVKARTVALGTKGGIRVSERLEVLDKRSAAMPGLYAGGFDAGGMYGDSYPIRVSSGLSSAFALNSGRIAGRNALAYLGYRDG